jgi:hypothetical protein
VALVANTRRPPWQASVARAMSPCSSFYAPTANSRYIRTTARNVAQCSVEEMRRALQRKRRPASSKPLPPEAVALADQYREAVTSRFPKGTLIKLQVRNHKGKAVVDLKGIPLDQMLRLAEALTSELPPVPEVRLVEKVLPVA